MKSHRTRAVWLLLAVSLSIADPTMACEPFREPSVDFRGIKTETALEAYIENVVYAQLDQDNKTYNACMKAKYGDDRMDRGFDEDTRRDAAFFKFDKQVRAAGKAHLALLAAQPFRGAYDGSQARSTGGASARIASSKDSAVSPRKENLAPATSSPNRGEIPPLPQQAPPRIGESSGTSAGAGDARMPDSYGAWRCVRIEADQYGSQVLRNGCAFDVEMYWRDNKGGWNQAAVRNGGAYRGGMKAVHAMACTAGDSLDRQRELCRKSGR